MVSKYFYSTNRRYLDFKIIKIKKRIIMPLNPDTESSSVSPKKSGSKNPLVVIIAVVVIAIVGLLIAIKVGAFTPPGWLMNILPPAFYPGAMRLLTTDSEEEKFAVMMQTGQPGICTITHQDTGEQMTYYVKDDKFKIETTEARDGETIETLIINDGEYHYFWSSTEPVGTKMKIVQPEEMPETEEFDQDYDFSWDFDDFEYDDDVETPYDITCRFTNVPDSTFVPPANIEFMDMSDMYGSDWFEYEETMDIPEFDEESMSELEDWAQQMEAQYSTE